MNANKVTPTQDDRECRVECPVCEGEGEIERRDIPLHHLHSEAPEYGFSECGECDGEGFVWTDQPRREAALKGRRG